MTTVADLPAVSIIYFSRLNLKIMEVDSIKNKYSACQSGETTLREANRKVAKEALALQVCFFRYIALTERNIRLVNYINGTWHTTKKDWNFIGSADNMQSWSYGFDSCQSFMFAASALAYCLL